MGLYLVQYCSIAVIGGAQIEKKRFDDLRAVMNSPQISEAARRVEQWLKKIKKEQEEKIKDQ